MKAGLEKWLGGSGFLIWALGVFVLLLLPKLAWLGWCLVLVALVVCYVAFREGSKRNPNRAYLLSVLGLGLCMFTILFGLVHLFLSY